MGVAEAIHRAQIGFVIALVMLGVTGALIWLGKIPSARRPFRDWTSRKKHPRLFWLAVGVWGVCGLYILEQALLHLVSLHALPI